MLRFFVLASALLCGLHSPAQSPSGKVFTLNGEISNAPNTLLLFITHENTDQEIDTIMTDANGRFSFVKAINKPVVARLLKPRFFDTDLFVAPGYQLTLTGDGSAYPVFQLSKKISGKGAAGNRYLVLKDSLQVTRKDTTEWYALDEHQLLSYIQRDKIFKDSIHQQVFKRAPKDDPWFAYFGRLVSMDNEFLRMYYLLVQANYNKTFSYEKTVSYIRDHCSKAVLDDIFNEKYVASPNYRTWFMHEYSTYLKVLRCRKDSNDCPAGNEKIQKLDIIASNFKGAMRERALYGNLKGGIQYSRSFEELNLRKQELPPYIALLKNKEDKDRLEKFFTEMETTLTKTQIGSPAPLFNAKDSSGKEYSLADYRGKVVYVDLWASWCGPCRQETPHFKKIYEKYKADDRVVFIGVAVSDKPDKWREALKEDQTHWLQLYDNTGKVQSAYVANSIPKFILINKEGNIVSFDAPMPSSGSELEKVLDQEIAK